jgi:hypothetical protein
LAKQLEKQEGCWGDQWDYEHYNAKILAKQDVQVIYIYICMNAKTIASGHVRRQALHRQKTDEVEQWAVCRHQASNKYTRR